MGRSTGRIQNVRFLWRTAGIDGEAIEFEWHISQGFTSLQILQKIQNDLQERNIEPEKFTDRIIFMSMFNGKGNDEICISNSEKSQDIREEIVARDTGRSEVLKMKRSGWKSKVSS